MIAVAIDAPLKIASFFLGASFGESQKNKPIAAKKIGMTIP